MPWQDAILEAMESHMIINQKGMRMHHHQLNGKWSYQTAQITSLS